MPKPPRTKVDTTIPNRDPTPINNSMHCDNRQLSSSETNQDSNIPSKESAHQPQVPFHSGNGTKETHQSLRNRWEGESSRYLHQAYTNGFSHQLEEQVHGDWTLEGLLEEWLEYEELGAGEDVRSTLLA